MEAVQLTGGWFARPNSMVDWASKTSLLLAELYDYGGPGSLGNNNLGLGLA